jgi:hypothetical protein
MIKSLISTLTVVGSIVMAFHASAEVIGGPIHGEGSIQPNGGTAKHLLEFYAFKDAKITVTGDGKSNLECYLTDDSGNVLTKSEGSRSKCYFSFNPIRTGICQLTIKNQGKVVSHYQMEAN